MPKRVQMTRQKGGWRAENPDAVIVARPTKWGNPFDWHAAQDVGYGNGRGAAVDAFRGWLCGQDWGIPQGQTRASMAGRRQVILRTLKELRGRDLACWCPIISSCGYVPCHADVLLSLSNNISLEEVIRENTRWAEGKAL